MADELTGRRILLTGATGTIGAAIAHRLSGAGATLVLVARDRSRVESLASQLSGGPHLTIALDVRDERAWQRVADEIAPQRVLDGVVAAAGVVTPIGPLGSWSVREFCTTIEVNVVGTLLAVTTCLPALRERRGAIVTFSGGGATAPLPRYDAYAASKAAVVRLTENIAADLAEDGVRANSVAPGFIVSAMHDETMNAGPDAVGASYFERTRKAIESGGGDDPNVAAELTEFLLSTRASGITGKLISAIWDPWRDPHFQQRLRDEGDLATLRRIDDQFYTTKSSGA